MFWIASVNVGYGLKLFKDVNISVESQKGIIAVHRCSLENQKGVLLYKVFSDSALLVLNGTSLNCNNVLLALNRQYFDKAF